jgi:hypothetical protein
MLAMRWSVFGPIFDGPLVKNRIPQAVFTVRTASVSAPWPSSRSF